MDELSPFVNGAKLWCFLSRPTVAFTSARQCCYERSSALMRVCKMDRRFHERSLVGLRALVGETENDQKHLRALVVDFTSARGVVGFCALFCT